MMVGQKKLDNQKLKWRIDNSLILVHLAMEWKWSTGSYVPKNHVSYFLNPGMILLILVIFKRGNVVLYDILTVRQAAFYTNLLEKLN